MDGKTADHLDLMGENKETGMKILEAREGKNGTEDIICNDVNTELQANNANNPEVSTPRNKSRYGRAHKPKISDDFLMTDRKVGAMFGQSPKQSPNNGNSVTTTRSLSSNARLKGRQVHEALKGTNFNINDSVRKEGHNMSNNTTDHHQKKEIGAGETVNGNSVSKQFPLEKDSEKVESGNKGYIIKPVEQLGSEPPNWEAGDLVWARVFGYPFWPALITLDEELNSFTKNKAIGRVLSQPHLHVQFFEDMGRHSWLAYSSVVPYKALSFMEANNELAEFRKNPRMMSAFHVKRSQKVKFFSAAEEANKMINMTRDERLKTFAKLYPPSRKTSDKENFQIPNSTQQKRKLSFQDDDKVLKKIKREKIVDSSSDDTSDSSISEFSAEDALKSDTSASHDTVSDKILTRSSVPLDELKKKATDKISNDKVATRSADVGSDKVKSAVGNKDSDKVKSAVGNKDSDKVKSAVGNKDSDKVKSAVGNKDSDKVKSAVGNKDSDKVKSAAGNKDSDKAKSAVGNKDSDKISKKSTDVSSDEVKRVTDKKGQDKNSAGNGDLDSNEEKKTSDKKVKSTKKNIKIKSEDSTESSEQSASNSRESTPESASAIGTDKDAPRAGGVLFRGVRRDKACSLCFKAGNAFKCRGICGNYFHPECVAIEMSKAQAVADGIKIEKERPNSKRKKGRQKKIKMEVKIKREHLENGIDANGLSSDDKENEGVPTTSQNQKNGNKISNKVCENNESNCGNVHTTVQIKKEIIEVNVKKRESLDDILEECVVTHEKCPATSKDSEIKSESNKINNTGESPQNEIDENAEENADNSKEIKLEAVANATTQEKSSNEEEQKIVDTNAGEKEQNIVDKTDSEKEAENFICHECSKGLPPKCFACGLETQESDRQFCSLAYCAKYYHAECLKLWPQATTNDISRTKKNKSVNGAVTLVCPQHKCHTCVSDDPRNVVVRYTNEPMVRCIQCPTAYHANDYCVPAGSEVLSGSQILCARHYKPLKGAKVPHSNTAWCFLCSMGGSLICCDLCPTSFHADCLRISPPEGSFICEDCETGRYPLFGEIVWVKLGPYRWWPARILFPNEVPENVNKIPHAYGEFCVKFFGSNDHFWVNRGRVFLYQDGDDVHSSVNKTKMDTTFIRALEEARDALKKYAEIKEARDAKVRPTIKPPSYIRIKTNKPVGSVRHMEGDVSNMTPCDCDPKSDNPCGPDSDCLNRILLVECSPLVCRAGDRCGNQCFEKREYPELRPYLTEDRGWGLKTLAALRKGQFVIEYVGEMINEEEYRRRIQRKHEEKDENFYFLIIDKDRLLDAGPKGNVARFMNHSCQPNCETQKWTVNGDTRVGLFALEDIPANTELTFNYNLESIGTDRKPCMCGAPNCSGFIGVKANNNKPADDDQKPRQLKAEEQKRVRCEKICFSCGDPGDLIICEAKTCPKAYHKDCVSLSHPSYRKWTCPWHFCNICNKRTIQKCNMCTNSFCILHAKGRIRTDGKNGYLCPYHDKGSSSKSKSSEKVGGTSTGRGNQKSPLHKTLKSITAYEKTPEDHKNTSSTNVKNENHVLDKKDISTIGTKEEPQNTKSTDRNAQTESGRNHFSSTPLSEISSSNCDTLNKKKVTVVEDFTPKRNSLSLSKNLAAENINNNLSQKNKKENQISADSEKQTHLESDTESENHTSRQLNKPSDVTEDLNVSCEAAIKEPKQSSTPQKTTSIKPYLSSMMALTGQNIVLRKRGRPKKSPRGRKRLSTPKDGKEGSNNASSCLNTENSSVTPGSVNSLQKRNRGRPRKELHKEIKGPNSAEFVESENNHTPLTVTKTESSSEKEEDANSLTGQKMKIGTSKLQNSAKTSNNKGNDTGATETSESNCRSLINICKKAGNRPNLQELSSESHTLEPRSKKRGRVPNRLYEDFEDVPVQKTPKLKTPLQNLNKLKRQSKESAVQLKKVAESKIVNSGKESAEVADLVLPSRRSLDDKAIVEKVDRNCISPLLLPVHG